MPYTQHPTITDAVINLSRHELGHYWMASLCGFFADGIQLHADHGACQIQYSMAPANFSEHYERSPIMAAAALTRIVSVIRIGTYVEVVAGQYGQELRGQDLKDTETWREAVLPVYGSDGWNRVYAATFQTIQSWYRHQRVQQVFREAAPAIAHQKSLSRYALLSLLSEAGADYAPEPRFSTVLAPARRSPSPASRQPAAPSGFSPATITAVHDAIRAGDFFDAQGRLRTPSRAEVSYLQQVNTDVQAGKRVPGLDG